MAKTVLPIELSVKENCFGLDDSLIQIGDQSRPLPEGIAAGFAHMVYG